MFSMQGLEVCLHPGNVNRSEGDAVVVFNETQEGPQRMQKLHVVSQMHTSIITLLELAFLSTIFRVP